MAPENATVQEFPGGDTAFWIVGCMDWEKSTKLPVNPALNQRYQTVECYISTGPSDDKDFLVIRTALSFDPEFLPNEGDLCRFDGIVRSTVSQQERVFTNLYIIETTTLKAAGTWEWQGAKVSGAESKISKLKEAPAFVPPTNVKPGNLAEKVEAARAKQANLQASTKAKTTKKPDLVISSEGDNPKVF